MGTTAKRILAAALTVGVIASGVAGVMLFANAEDSNRLMNGNFEEPAFTGTYTQYTNDNVPYWETTAYNTTGQNGKIELFRANNGTYVPGVTLTPSEGSQAAELNADEESSLYQVVSTYPSTIYEWGLDHGSRTNLDTMALIIGPEQEIAPSKTFGLGYNQGDLSNYENPPLREGYKYGRDQWMQMVDWLKDTGVIEKPTTAGIYNDGQNIVVFSKKFDEHGSFQNNEDGQPFSLTPSSTYTEEWHIWIMSDSCSTDASVPNPWTSYGANAGGSTAQQSIAEAADSSETNSVTEVYTDDEEVEDGSIMPSDPSFDASKYYLYTVPTGQTKTMFAFTSVYNSYRIDLYNKNGWTSIDPTYGNFLDNIHFALYHPLTGSTTTHGSAIIGNSDGTSSGAGEGGYSVTVDNEFAAYATDGDPLVINAVIPKENVDTVKFVGVYYTVQEMVDGKFESVTRFISLIDHLAPDGETDPTGQWIMFVTDDGDIVYKYALDNISSAVDVHFVFVKSPMITYDPNGGKTYYCTETGSNKPTEDTNVYSFEPSSASDAGEEYVDYVEPFVAHVAEPPDSVADKSSWRLIGWKVNDDWGVVTNDDGTDMVISPEHSVVCNFQQDLAQDTDVQPFVIYDDPLTFSQQTNLNGTTFTPDDATQTPVYDKNATGLTMVAQWRWRQAFIPQVIDDTLGWRDTDVGGTVSVVSGSDSETDIGESYNPNGGTGGKAYYSGINETVSAKAVAKLGYSFEGWYDADGNFLTMNAVYTYAAGKESVNTVYAHFVPNSKQYYIRQVFVDDEWVETEDDTIATLSIYMGEEAMGAQAVSKATSYGNYKFVGWFDEDGNEIPDSMYNTARDTIIYNVEQPITTYYARFRQSFVVNFVAQTEVASKPGTFTNSDKGGIVDPELARYFEGDTVSSTAARKANYEFAGWYDADGNLLCENEYFEPQVSAETDGMTYYARFRFTEYTVKFIPYTKEAGETTPRQNTNGGTLSETEVTGRYSIDKAVSTAAAKDAYRFVGWYTSYSNMVNNRSGDSNLTKSVTISGNATYYALFEAIDYEIKLEGPYTSFVKEEVDGDGDDTNDVPAFFSSAIAGTGRNSIDPGRTDGFGNTISTGFKYSIGSKENASVIRIDITVPAGSYIKIGTVTTEAYFGNIPHEDTPVMTDSADVIYNKGSIYKTTEARTLSCYWSAADVKEGKTYAFIVDGLFTTDDATAEIFVNRGEQGFAVDGGKTTLISPADGYRENSHYPIYEKVIEIVSSIADSNNNDTMRGLMVDLVTRFLKKVI